MTGRRNNKPRTAPVNRPGLAVAAGAGAAIVVLAGLLMWAMGSGAARRADQLHIGGPFSLVSGEGVTVTDRSFPGKYLLIYFGYSRCADVCPATLNTMAAALGRLGGKAMRVQPLFITIDPQRDTPAVLHHYVGTFSPRLVGLTGAPGALARVEDEYGVASIVHREGGAAKGYALDHSSVVYLMAPDGRFLAPIPASASEMVMVRAIGKYID